MEGEQLLKNIKSQIKKLIDQLKDLEDNKEDFEADEYLYFLVIKSPQRRLD
jgi:hypothetical protein